VAKSFVIIGAFVLIPVGLALALCFGLKALVPEFHAGLRIAISAVLALIIYIVAICHFDGFSPSPEEPPVVLGLMVMFAVAVIWRLTRGGR
jgi:hypothetical protein